MTTTHIKDLIQSKVNKLKNNARQIKIRKPQSSTKLKTTWEMNTFWKDGFRNADVYSVKSFLTF